MSKQNISVVKNGKEFTVTVTYVDLGPGQALHLALDFGQPIPEFEEIIATKAETALLYAKEVLGTRFEMGEAAIAMDAISCSQYLMWMEDTRYDVWGDEATYIKNTPQQNMRVWQDYMTYRNERLDETIAL